MNWLFIAGVVLVVVAVMGVKAFFDIAHGKICKGCWNGVDVNATTCPKCGRPNPTKK